MTLLTIVRGYAEEKAYPVWSSGPGMTEEPTVGGPCNVKKLGSPVVITLES